MKGKEIIAMVEPVIKKATTMDELTIVSMNAHIELLEIHARALACHCECLGMNAENSQRAMLGQVIAYSDDSYLACMTKWGLMTEKGEPTI